MAKTSNVTVAQAVVTPEEANQELIALTLGHANMKSALTQERARAKLVRMEVQVQREQIVVLMAGLDALKKQVGALNLKVVNAVGAANNDRRTEWNDAVARMREADGDSTAYYDPADVRAEIARGKQEVKAPMQVAEEEEEDVAF